MASPRDAPRADRSSRSSSLARATRDLIVPIGHSQTAAASAYVRPMICVSTSAALRSTCSSERSSSSVRRRLRMRLRGGAGRPVGQLAPPAPSPGHAFGTPPGDHEEPCLCRCLTSKRRQRPPHRQERLLYGVVSVGRPDYMGTEPPHRPVRRPNEGRERPLVAFLRANEKAVQLVHHRDRNAGIWVWLSSKPR